MIIWAEILCCRTPLVIFVPGDANGWLSEVLSGPMHRSTQVCVTTTTIIMEVLALQAAVLNCESVSVLIHVWTFIQVKLHLLGGETRRVPAR